MPTAVVDFNERLFAFTAAVGGHALRLTRQASATAGRPVRCRTRHMPNWTDQLRVEVLGMRSSSFCPRRVMGSPTTSLPTKLNFWPKTSGRRWIVDADKPGTVRVRKNGHVRSHADFSPLGISTIGEEPTIAGDVTSKGELHIDGHVQGDVYYVALVLGENAQLEGNVVAEDVTVRGHLIGSVSALTVTLEANSRVEGNLFIRVFP